MWVWHSCLASLNGPCQPRTDGELAEWVIAAAVAFTALLGGFCALLGALGWLEEWL